MRKAIFTAAILTAATCGLTAADAKPLDPAFVAAGAKWVIHVDADQARAGKLWGPIKEKLQTDERLMARLDELARYTGMHLFDDLHDLTVYGDKLGDDAAVTVVRATIDKAKTMAALQLNTGFTDKLVGTHDVLTWDDDGKTNYGCFFDAGTVVIGHDTDQVEAALAVLDDKAKALKADDGLIASAGDKQVAFIAVRDFPALQPPGGSPLLQKIESGYLVADEADAGLFVSGKFLTKDADTAKQLNTTLTGLAAMVGMMGNGQKNDPRTLAGDALKTLKLKPDAAAVDVAWPISPDILDRLIDQRLRAEH